VPAVSGLTKFNRRQIGQTNGIQVDGSVDANDRYDRGKDFRRPIDRLILRRGCGISPEKIGPMSFGTSRSSPD